MYCRPKILGLNTTRNQIFVLYSTTNATYIINIHCFRAVVEIPCGEKSAMSETSNFGLRFFEMPLQKNVKRRVFWIFKKKRKKTYSGTML